MQSASYVAPYGDDLGVNPMNNAWSSQVPPSWPGSKHPFSVMHHMQSGPSGARTLKVLVVRGTVPASVAKPASPPSGTGSGSSHSTSVHASTGALRVGGAGTSAGASATV